MSTTMLYHFTHQCLDITYLMYITGFRLECVSHFVYYILVNFNVCNV